MGSGEWRDRYEDHADEERAKLDRLSVRDLCARIQAGKLDGYHQIWQSLAAKATLPEVGWFLFSFLESDKEYLPRYHCANALLRLMEEDRWQAVDLSAEWGRGKNLPLVAAALTEKIGPRR